jgi:[Skp1-protein]-hydroxyproline N-acetylglucosaminyltransferase
MHAKPGAIFVSIASYRDDVCSSTLDSLYTMADKKERVYVGICQQNKNEEDIDCVSKNYQDHPNVKIIRIPHFDAKGPTHARYLCSTLWNGEEYFLQIDSHTKFVKGWDTLCIGMLMDIKNKNLSKKPVLSHYPKEITTYDNYNETTKSTVPRMCKSFFNDRGMISFMGAEEIDSNNTPYMTPYVAGGMIFCESYFLKELPFDPNLPFLFVGEEILHSIRFYTHGWDIFTPTENIVFHEYTRKDKPKIWTDNPYYSDVPAFDKVKHYLKLVNNEPKLEDYLKFNLDKYGLGNVRTLEDYYNFAGIDIVNKKVYKNFCKENNIATENDILMSNQINHEKNKNITKNNTSFLSLKNTMLFLIAIGIIAVVIYYILNKLKITF